MPGCFRIPLFALRSSSELSTSVSNLRTSSTKLHLTHCPQGTCRIGGTHAQNLRTCYLSTTVHHPFVMLSPSSLTRHQSSPFGSPLVSLLPTSPPDMIRVTDLFACAQEPEHLPSRRSIGPPTGTSWPPWYPRKRLPGTSAVLGGWPSPARLPTNPPSGRHLFPPSTFRKRATLP